ncbi:MAG: response regulator [Zoogloeaceae bacterium]|nr:response regulator [Zoogloeaceae bacterium]
MKDDIQRRQVLLVEDSKLFQVVFASVFRNTAFEVQFSPSGEEALAAVKDRTFDLLCSSYYLADMEGIDLCRQIRSDSRYAYTPFILFTSVGSPDELKRALPTGVTDIFHKSDIEDLVTYIKRYPFHDERLTGRVLYVEDTRAHRELVKALLEDHGLEVEAFNSADEAWERFHPHDYDLVITDIVLEGKMSGLTFVNRIRRLPDERGEIPILAVTAFDDHTRRIELFSIGVTDYVTKPIIEVELVARVKNLLAKHRALREMRRQMQAAERANLAKSRFLAMVSHELRTPLNGILGFTQLLEMDAEEGLLRPHQQEHVAQIRASGEHLLALMEDLLDLSRVEEGKLVIENQSIALRPTVEACLSKVRFLAEKQGIRLEDMTAEHTVDPAMVRADPRRLGQVVVNLLTNAIKYNRQGGKVVLALGAGPKTGFHRISVTDTGQGLTEDQQSRLFQPFVRLTEKREEIQGTGLGLAISKHLVERMGGRLGLDSTPGEGSTFWVDLPALAMEAA